MFFLLYLFKKYFSYFVVFDPLIANVSVVTFYSLSLALLCSSYFVSLILIFNVLALEDKEVK